MVDAIVSFAVQKLGNFLIEEANVRLSLKGNVFWLQSQLIKMLKFLKYAEDQQVKDPMVLQYVFDIRNIANEAVAILETYSMAGDQREDHGCASRLKSCTCKCRKETKLNNVGKEIESLRQRLEAIAHERDTYDIRSIKNAGEGPSNLPNNQSARDRKLRITDSFVDDQDLTFVGNQDAVERLLAELLKEEPRRSVISIYGMGGLGKTTLARNIYTSPKIVSTFETRAWIYVSQEYNTMDLLMDIIKSIRGCNKETIDLLERMTERDLRIHLRDQLKDCKYLLVIDDVWQREAWESLKRAFPDDKKGSRVIITTRKEDVSERADDKDFAHRLRFLSKAESWDLFCRKLLDIRTMAPAMKRLARDMVDKCGGLPLAIVVLSGLLSHKKDLEEWQQVKDHLWHNITEAGTSQISHILSLSYNDLPTELKQCFLYFGTFPENQVVHSDNIIWLWMAEGLVPRGETRMEDVAEGFLNELIRRNLIQVRHTFWGKVTECRIHGLLRDLVVKKALEINFFGIYDPINHSISPLCLRHAIHGEAQKYLSLDLSKTKLRSVMFLHPDFSNTNLIKFHKVFQHLYVLYLENHSVSDELPDVIGSLSQLKFLRVTDISTLPSSIGKLKNLQTIHVNDYGQLCQLPPETVDLINLRHLVAPYSKPLKRVSKLESLQVLEGISCDQWKDDDPVGLVNLRKLSMYDIKESYSLNNISSLQNLSTLVLSCKPDESFPDLEFLSPCQHLHKLWLDGGIKKLPSSGPLLDSITMLVLQYSNLMDDPMPILGKLPNLRNLDFVAAYGGRDITCNDNSFCQLEFLRLDDLPKLDSWHLPTSSMPLIKGLGIHDCPKLKEIPERLKDIPKLERLQGIHLV